VISWYFGSDGKVEKPNPLKYLAFGLSKNGNWSWVSCPLAIRSCVQTPLTPWESLKSFWSTSLFLIGVCGTVHFRKHCTSYSPSGAVYLLKICWLICFWFSGELGKLMNCARNVILSKAGCSIGRVPCHESGFKIISKKLSAFMGIIEDHSTWLHFQANGITTVQYFLFLLMPMSWDLTVIFKDSCEKLWRCK